MDANQVTGNLSNQTGTSTKPTSKRTSRNWTEDEKVMFSIILADPDDDYALKLERMALNKTANSELFSEIAEMPDTRNETT